MSIICTCRTCRGQVFSISLLTSVKDFKVSLVQKLLADDRLVERSKIGRKVEIRHGNCGASITNDLQFGKLPQMGPSPSEGRPNLVWRPVICRVSSVFAVRVEQLSSNKT
ncbi:hypothetical protein WA026_017229 [Henosepilachna vigintioctopunctata]|uniref:DNA-directed RNA polymerase n=1 Tax=Henosepilachna vigintioctopunctata TaxID=420089 RepID=A0AAW1UDI0_9CUCU